MADALLLTAAFWCAMCGMGWLALALESHWAEVQSAARYDAVIARRLRSLGAAALLLSLGACLAADHPSMAFLVWVMTLSASAVVVAMLLAYAPAWLSWLADLEHVLSRCWPWSAPRKRYK